MRDLAPACRWSFWVDRDIPADFVEDRQWLCPYNEKMLMAVMYTAFLDESRRDAHYIVCVAMVVVEELESARKVLRALRLPGQRRIHFAAESDRRRRKLLSEIAELDLTTAIYSIRHSGDTVARTLILAAMVPDLRSRGVVRLVIESRESQDRRDRVDLYRAVGPDPDPAFTYRHQTPASEPLLWVPDAVAWAWGRNAEWRRRVNDLGLVGSVTDIEWS